MSMTTAVERRVLSDHDLADLRTIAAYVAVRRLWSANEWRRHVPSLDARIRDRGGHPKDCPLSRVVAREWNPAPEYPNLQDLINEWEAVP
ncbi:MAG: hypothetical protein ABSE58_08995 [Candidatus Limnocylindrales bacterium]